jgi:spermidine synthase
VHAGVLDGTMALMSDKDQKPGSESLVGLLFSRIKSICLHSRHTALLYIGFGSTISQILLVREFLVSFYGNELSIGIIFACWLMWIGLGSAFGNVIITYKNIVSRIFPGLLAVTPFITFAQILAIKFIRVFLHSMHGEFLSMLELLSSSFIVLSAGSFLWGMLFTLGAKLNSSDKDESWLGVNAAYVLESLGSVLGGLVFSFVLVGVLTTFQILFLLTVLAIGVALRMVLPTRKIYSVVSLASIIVMVVLLQPLRSFENAVRIFQWSFCNTQMGFVRSMDTKYQNLTLLVLEHQYTVYADGRPVYNIPNAYDAEIFTHPVMIHHPDAKRVLVVGGGFNGILKEILKYPVQEIEYVEMDPALLPFVEPVISIRDRQALYDSRVHIIHMDGREFLQRNILPFDVIVMNVGEPSTASVNRFYTEEFFRQCYQSLKRNGLFAFSFPSSEEYLADELKDLNVSIYQTLKMVFKNTLIIPGTHATLIGTKSTIPLTSLPDSLARRYASIGISADYFTKYTFDELMPPDRITFITKTLESSQHVRWNTDSTPVTYFYDLILWNKFLRGGNWFFAYITPFWIFTTGVVASVLALFFIILQRGKPEKQKKTALSLIMALCGMTGMALNLLLLLNYQEAFGSVYEQVGTMIAANMLGLAAGVFAAQRLMRKFKQERLVLSVLMVLILLAVFLPTLLRLLLRIHLMSATLSVTLLCGGLIGILFGSVNRLYLQWSSNLGSVYAFDVFGSSLGALTTCSVLLPVLGIQGVTYFFSLLLILAMLGSWFLYNATRSA